MRIIQDSDLLFIWEQGLELGLPHFGLLLLKAAFPDASIEDLKRLPIGKRDGLLLLIRGQIMGPSLVGLADCPRCGETMELNLSISDIQIKSEPEISDPNSLSINESGYEIKTQGYVIGFRLPDSTDQEAALCFADPAKAKTEILRRCIRSARFNDEDIEAEELPALITEMIAENMARADPQADVLLKIGCTSCSHEWDCIFDISSFLWKELDRWSHKRLFEVHTLAQSYGWSEAEILSLSPWRRRHYLEMICR
jgi:hypothetical protein